MPDDFRNTPTAPGTVGSVPTGTFDTGDLEIAGDTDVFSTTLIQGLTYTIEQRGADTGDGTLPDPFLYLVDGSNTEITHAMTTRGRFRNSLIQFTPGATDTYFLRAESFPGRRRRGLQ